MLIVYNKTKGESQIIDSTEFIKFRKDMNDKLTRSTLISPNACIRIRDAAFFDMEDHLVINIIEGFKEIHGDEHCMFLQHDTIRIKSEYAAIILKDFPKTKIFSEKAFGADSFIKIEDLKMHDFVNIVNSIANLNAS